MSIPVYLAVSPEEAGLLPDAPHPLALLGYRLDETSPALLGPQLEAQPESLMVLQDDAVPAYRPDGALVRCIAELAASVHGGIVCDFTGPAQPYWREFLALLGPVCRERELPLWVPEAYAPAAAHALVIVGSDCTDAAFARHVQRAAGRYPGRCALELRPLSVTLSRAGRGRPRAVEEPEPPPAAREAPVFQSPELLCAYRSRWGADALHVTLFDTAQTLRRKLECAEAAGFQAAIGLCQELRRLRADPE